MSLTPADWGVVNVYAVGLRPSTRYEIRANCGAAAGANLSVAVARVTWLWGDVNHSATCNGGLKAGLPCNRGGDCPGAACFGVTFTDISATVNAFKGLYTPTLTMEAADIIGTTCAPNRDVSFYDIGRVVEAYKSIPLSCPLPCLP